MYVPVLLNETKNVANFEHVADYSNKDGFSSALLLQGRLQGQLLVKGQHTIQICRSGALAMSFVVNKQEKLNVSTEVRLERIHGKA